MIPESTPQVIAKYRIKKSRRLTALRPRLAHSRADLARFYRGRIVRHDQSCGIGDIVIPRTGDFAGTPLICQGFTCTQIDPVFGLPAGRCDFLICKLLYSKDDPHAAGMTTGITIYLPIDEQ